MTYEDDADGKQKKYGYRMPHLDKIGDFIDDLELGQKTNASVMYVQAIVLNRVANELRLANDLTMVKQGLDPVAEREARGIYQ